MPSNRKRTTDKAKWSKEALEAAIICIKNGTSIRQASKLHRIPVTTLFDRIKKPSLEPPSLGRHSTFTPGQESEFSLHIIRLSKMFYGLTPKDIRRASFTFAESNQIKHSFNKDKKIAGKDWFYGFLRRNRKLAIRKPEATSINRILGFNRHEVGIFFANLEEVMVKYKFEPTEIWNMDETGISTVQDNGVVVAEKGQKRVGTVTSWERGKTITVLCCMGAAGQFVPPMFIFPRTRMTPLLEKDGPPGAVYSCSKSGWTNEDIFIEWVNHFTKHVKPSKEKPVLLIMDNHSSHCTLEAFDMWRKNGIVVVSIPPHTSHRLQPLDVTYYSSLKAAYNKECDIYMKTKRFEKITPYDVAGLFSKAYGSVTTVSKGITGFANTGIYPFNPNIFTDEDFLVEDTCFQHQQQSNDTVTDVTLSPVINEASVSPGTSFQEILPIPTTSKANQADPPKKKIGRPKQRSEILSSTPMKCSLEVKRQKKLEKNKKLKINVKTSENNKIRKEKKEPQEYRKGNNKRKGKTLVKVTKKAKRNLLKEFESTSEEDMSEIDLCDDNELDDIETNQEKCFVCDEYGQDQEMWYRCTGCGMWVHAECSGWDFPEGYMCDICIKK